MNDEKYFELSRIVRLFPHKTLGQKKIIEKIEDLNYALNHFGKNHNTRFVFKAGETKIAFLKNDEYYNGFKLSHEHEVEFYRTGEIVRGRLAQDTIIEDNVIPRNSLIVFHKRPKYQEIILSQPTYIFNKYCRSGFRFSVCDDEEKNPLKNNSHKCANMEDHTSTIVTYKFIKANHKDGGKYIGFHRREGNKFGSLSSYDIYNDDDEPDFPFGIDVL